MLLGLIKNLTGFVVGENSHKRELGLLVVAGLSVAMHLGWITPEEYTAWMPIAGLLTGVAFEFRIRKIRKATLAATGE